jgi:hypothetical protein
MASITLKGLPDELKARLEEIADRKWPGPDEQTPLLLGRVVREEPAGFEQAYRRFRNRRGTSPLKEGDLEGLRSGKKGKL